MIKNLLSYIKPYFKIVIQKLRQVSKPNFKSVIQNLKQISTPSFQFKHPENFNFQLLNKRNNLDEIPNLFYIKEFSNSDMDFQNKFLKTLSDEYESDLHAYLFYIEMGSTTCGSG